MNAQVQFPATPDNIALAHRVHARMRADERIVNAKAAFWRFLGIGGLIGIASLGIAAAIFAYSYVTDSRTSAEQIALAITSALNKTTLKSEGSVILQPGAQVALSDNQLRLDNARVKLDASSVKLDTGESTIRLAPNASVRMEPGASVAIQPGGTVNVAGTVGVSGDGTRPVATAAQLQPDMQSQNGAKVMTGITAFKMVDHLQGQVVTGWNYKTSDDNVPETQYCYYRQGVQGAMVQIDVARDGKAIPVTNAPRSFNAQEVASHCLWFDRSRTREF